MNDNVLELWKSNQGERVQKENDKRSQDEERIKQFNSWLDNSFPGDTKIYFTGQWLQGPVGRNAWQAYRDGLVVLYQTKTEKKGHFNYWAKRLATKRPK